MQCHWLDCVWMPRKWQTLLGMAAAGIVGGGHYCRSMVMFVSVELLFESGAVAADALRCSTQFVNCRKSIKIIKINRKRFVY